MKFIDKHKRVLAELLDLQLDPARVDATAPDFEGRYGFRRKPDYVRLRTAVGDPCTELTVRTDELAAPPPGVTHAYIVENEITYLAFPLAPDAIVIFGGGYAVNVLERLDWLVLQCGARPARCGRPGPMRSVRLGGLQSASVPPQAPPWNRAEALSQRNGSATGVFPLE